MLNALLLAGGLLLANPHYDSAGGSSAVDGSGVCSADLDLNGNAIIDSTGSVWVKDTMSVGMATNSSAGGLHIFSEAPNNTPGAFTSNHTLVGRQAASGVNSGAVFVQYEPVGNTGLIGSLSPSVAWRELRFSTSNLTVYINGSSKAFDIAGTTTTVTGDLVVSDSISIGGVSSMATCDATTVKTLVTYTKAASNLISMCFCAQTGVATYAWEALNASGDCT